MKPKRSASLDAGGKARLAPGTLVTLALALLLLGVLTKLVIDLVRDFWIIVIAMMQP